MSTRPGVDVVSRVMTQRRPPLILVAATAHRARSLGFAPFRLDADALERLLRPSALC